MVEPLKVLNVAIVGGGPGCKAIMDMIFAEKLKGLRMKLIGVADVDPEAIGYKYAQEKRIYTTNDYRDFYKLKDLDLIIELTGLDEVANVISRTKPDQVRLIDHVAARVFWDLFQIEEERLAERERTEYALQRAYDDLERRVKERTAELAEVNRKLRLEITKREQAEGIIRRRLKFEKTVSAISSRFINNPDIDNAIKDSLADIGQISGADRAYLFLFSPDGTIMNNTHEWCAEGVSPEINNLKNLPTALFPWWMSKLRKGKVIHIKDISKMPKKAEAEREILERQSIKSLLVLPVNFKEEPAGFIGLDNVKTTGEWSGDDLTILRTVSELIGNALERKQAEEALLGSEERYRAIVEDLPGMVCRFLPDGTLTFVNEAYCNYFNKTKEELIGQNFFRFIPEREQEKIKGHFMSLTQEMPMITYEHPVIAPDETLRWQQWTDRALFNEQGRLIEYQSLGRDITEEKQAQDEKNRLEKQLQQIQKMEAIGTLAGGMAHDFNNLLTVIEGYTSMALMETDEATSLSRKLKQVLWAASRAAELTRQLLLFSRKQPTKLTLLNINKTINNLLGMFKRLIGEDITIVTNLEPHLWTIQADETNLEQVIMNIAVNARDAMPGGGKMIIQTENVALDQKDCQIIPEARPGKFVRLSIADTGVGIDQVTMENIFEPFFSTKAPGEGTGLGLAVVYGIVKQHGGFINVCSKPKKGTTFEIYLPFFATKLKEKPEKPMDLKGLQGNGERILLIEDEAGIRKFTVEALSKNGYLVFEAAGPREALKLFTQERGNFHLVFSDVVLPDQSGLELAEQFILYKPELTILLTSGYTNGKAQWSAIHKKGFQFLQKPYNLLDLLQTVKKALAAVHGGTTKTGSRKAGL